MDLTEDWTQVEDQLLQRLKAYLGPVRGNYQPAAMPKADQQRLPFYNKTQLIRLHGRGYWRAILPQYVIATETRFHPLDGHSPVIRETNTDAKLTLTEANIRSYLKFFCFFVRSEEGPFLILEKETDLQFIECADLQTKAEIAGHIRPTIYRGRNDKGDFLCNAVVYYGDILFEANFAIEKDGDLEMLDETLLIGPLNAHPNAPL